MYAVSGREMRLIALAAIVLVGAFFRFFELWRFPVGFHFDEAADLVDIWRLGSGFHPIYFEANNGREPFYFYWAALFVRGIGASPQALRLSSAFLGVATLPAIYFCVVELLRPSEGLRRARRVAVWAAAVAAFLFMHVNFSRIGLRTISLPLAECLAFGLLWMAFRRQRSALFALAGLALAASMYTYTAARLLILALALFALYWVALRRRISNVRGLALSAGAFVLGSLPLAVYAGTHASSFFQRTEGVAVTDRQAVVANLVAMLKLFVLQGSLNGAHNVIGMPLFDWPMRLAFVVGVVLLAARLHQPAYAFVLLWLGTVSLASIFSPDAPYYIRLTALIPPVVLVPALALERLPVWLERVKLRRIGRQRFPPKSPAGWRYVPSLALVGASAAFTYHSYFQVWGPSNDTYFWMMQDKVDAAAYLREEASAGRQVFLAPLYAQDWTFQAVDHNQPIQSFNPAQCLVVPTGGRDALYAFPPYDVTQPEVLLPRLPSSAVERPVVNTLRQPVLIEVRVPGRDLPPSENRVLGSFGHEIGLLRVEGLPTVPVRPRTVVPLTLVWQALAQPAADYTAYVHADDNVNRLRTQQDHPPCLGSFPTSRWLPGEQVFDGYTVTVPANAPSGRYDVTVGLYELPGPRNLQLDGGDTELGVGSFEVRP